MIDALQKIIGGVAGHFNGFEQVAAVFWHKLDGDAFRELQQQITQHHGLAGTVLCGLVVKLDLWRRKFPAGGGGPSKRLEFIEAELMPGFELVIEAERDLAA